MAITAMPPSGILPRFSLLIEAMKRGLIEGARRRQRIGPTGPPGSLVGVLLKYLMDTWRRLTALQARLAAGKLPTAPRRTATPRPTADRPRPPRRPPAIPSGPVLRQYGMAYFAYALRDLLDDPEMQALLAAAPQAGRLLRPLWRKLSPEPLPEVLRLLPGPRSVAPWPDPAAGPANEPAAPASRPTAPPPAWGRPAPPEQARRPLPSWVMGLFRR